MACEDKADRRLNRLQAIMPPDTDRLRSQLTTLNASLDVLEGAVDQLLANPLNDTLLGLDTIQQAKLQTLIPYAIYDLIFIYLKSSGIDPRSHAVVSELERVRQYFDKIASAENSPHRRLTLDKAAAGRFIKHALAQAQHQTNTPSDPSEPSGPAGAAPTPNPVSASTIPVKVTSKMLERSQYEKGLREADDDEDPELQVFHSPEDEDKRNSRDPVAQASEDNQTRTKRKRPTMDPFAGYGDYPAENADGKRGEYKLGSESGSHPPSGRSTPIAKSSKKVKKSKR